MQRPKKSMEDPGPPFLQKWVTLSGKTCFYLSNTQIKLFSLMTRKTAPEVWKNKEDPGIPFT